MKRLARYAKWVRSALGRDGMIGCTLLALAAIVHVSAVMPKQALRDGVMAEAQALQARHRMLGNTTAGKPGLDEQLRTFQFHVPGRFHAVIHHQHEHMRVRVGPVHLADAAAERDG